MSDRSTIPRQFQLKLNGADAPDELARVLMSISVESTLGQPDLATVDVHDTKLEWVDSDLFAPGAPLIVLAMGANDFEPIFDGEIVELEPEYAAGGVVLRVLALDRLHRLTRHRPVRSFQNVTDSDLFEKLAQEVGLKAKIEVTGELHPYFFQYHETGLALIQRRAHALGAVFYVEGLTLRVVPVDRGDPPVQLAWGEGLSELRPRLSTLDQVKRVTVRGWDPSTRQEILSEVQDGARQAKIGEARGGGDLVADAFQLDASAQHLDQPVRSQAEADRLARAMADRLADRSVEAEGVAAGDPALVAGVRVQLDGLGKRFNGTYTLTSATHRYQPGGGYTVAFTVSGLSPVTLGSALAPAREAPLTAAIGVVTDVQDPDQQGRVRVRFPWLSKDHASAWARVVSAGAGPDRGLQILPEVDDEVLVLFEQGDIRSPYVLGGLWNGKDAPPAPVQGQTIDQRVLVTRAGHTLLFDDTRGKEKVQIVDKKGNAVTLDAAKSAVTIESTGDLTLKANGGITVQAGANVKISGKLIDLN